MTLTEAYRGWGEMIQNKELYLKTKKAFADSWNILSWQHPCSYYTKEVLGEALAVPHVIESQKKVACRTMIAVLDWANFFENGNPVPDFSIDDLMAYTRSSEIINSIPQQPTPSATSLSPVITDMEEIQKVISKSIKQEEMNTGIKQKKAVHQLDPDTLEIIQSFESISEARKQLGTININRALTDITKAGGFYWAYPDQLEEMKKAIKDKQEGKEVEVVNRPASKPKPEKAEENTPQEENWMVAISDFSDSDLIAELKKRGYTGSLTVTKTVEL